MKYFQIVFIFILLLAITVASGQQFSLDKEKLIQMAQSGRLSSMNPEEVRNLIKQSGMTEEEIVRYARERNVDFSQYLGGSAQQSRSSGEESDSIRIPVSHPASRKEIMSVPSFSNRWDAKDLKPFGYDIFQFSPTTFEPVTNAPTPTGYRVGPGDELIINVWGQTQLNYQLTVGRDGYVVVPEAGKIQVEGQTADQIRLRLLARMTQVYEGLRNGNANATTFLDVSLGKIRTIQVFVMGEVQVPGGYNLSGLASVFTAVYYAGGPSVEGSMRRVRVVHADATVDTVDFYDYMLYGNKTVDVHLRDGDAVFVPPVGPRAAIAGFVKRPAIYELRHGEQLHHIFTMAGGLRNEAYDKRVHIERIVPFGQRAQYQKSVLDIDVSFSNADEMVSSKYGLEDGDVVSVYGISNERENLLYISGNVNKPGRYELESGMTVRDLIVKADSIREDTFLEHATIYRVMPDLKKEILSINLRKAISQEPQDNILLQKLDSVVIYRDDFFNPVHSVSIDGAVRKAGYFERTEHMKVRDLIILAGGVLEGADLHNIEVSRVDVATHKTIAKIFHLSLNEDYWNANSDADFELMDFDRVSVRKKPEFSLLKTVVVSGDAQYPGTYAIEYEGERLSSLLKRFGGFKSTAYLQGVRFLRQIGTLGITRPSPDIVETQQLDTLMIKYNYIKKVRTASKEVPIDVENIQNDTTSLDNLALQDGDSLIIPRDPGVVYVEGQVYVPSSVPYKKGASLDYYLRQAGGVKRDADEDNVVVVLPNNRKWEPAGFLGSDPEILSGSTIIAPLKIDEPSQTLSILREWVTIAASTTTLAFIVWQVTR